MALVSTSAGGGGAKSKSAFTFGFAIFGIVMRSKSIGVAPASLALATVCGAWRANGVLPQPTDKSEKNAEFARKTKVFLITIRSAPLRESSASASILDVDAAKAIAGREKQFSERE